MINTIMKINELATSDIDLAYWKEPDRFLNPEAYEYVGKQERRQSIIDKKSPSSTNIVTKPVRKAQASFTNKGNTDEPKSAGFAGNVDVQVRAGHISRKAGKKLIDQD